MAAYRRGLWLTSPAGWVPRTGISSGTLWLSSSIGYLYLYLILWRCVGSDHYSHNIYSESDLILPACGELVVVRDTANERWYRAAVLGHDCENNIKVHRVIVWLEVLSFTHAGMVLAMALCVYLSHIIRSSVEMAEWVAWLHLRQVILVNGCHQHINDQLFWPLLC